MNSTDTPRTDALMQNGCIAINIMEHARTLERELNNTPPHAASGEVWPEILRLQGKIASLDMQLTASLGNQLQSEETISQLLSQIPQASTEDSSVVQTDTPRTDAAEPQLHSHLGGWVRADFAREIELELAASQAQSHGMSRRVVEAEMKLEIANKDLRASEAEVERLRTQLKRAIEIAEMFSQVKGLHYRCNCAMCQLLGDLKRELK